ncbi:MAG TPA: ATP-binding cassette domain-containing protein [Egibacteraceae bacterium]|nr:ATP-binding cassette domain-containing protein [Egibacteraceae bacterium]
MVEPIVRVSGLSKTFGAAVKALDNVSLEFEAGIIFGLLGPNGAGKTTLIRVLATLLRPDSGAAEVAGIDVLKDPAAVRSRIGLAGQYAAVDGYQSGRENVEMVGRLYGLPRAEARRRADDVLEAIGLSDAADRPVKTYSGGMRRRLDLAASLVGRPQVLFLDEPTTGIDPRSRKDLWGMIRGLVDHGTTILLTTQYLEEVDQLAQRIAVLDEGRVVTEGTADQLKRQVGGAVIAVTVPDEDRAAALGALAAFLDGEAPLDTWEAGAPITMPAPDGARSLMEAIRRLDAAGIEPDDVALHKPTLDDVFLTLTGHAAPLETESPAGRRGGRARRSRR